MMRSKWGLVCGVLLLAFTISAAAVGQDETTAEKEKAKEPPKSTEVLTPAPPKVDVQPVAQDDKIRQRLERVLEATRWFTDVKVRVQDGVVFLEGQTQRGDLKTWAGDLARNTQDVVAVANRIEVQEQSIWDYTEAWNGLEGIYGDIVRFIPFGMFGFVVLLLFLAAAWFATRFSRSFLVAHVQAKLLRETAARGIGIVVLLIGIYVVLRISGLTQLALTVVGGTGLIGLGLGIAFRDITENFLASIFLSMQRPFETGDLIEVDGVTGYVRNLNVRTTVLMTLEGNLVQIPNATIYKSNIRNFTTNPNRREQFDIALDHSKSIEVAQEVGRQILLDHPAVLKDPEPLILAESLSPTSITLRFYFWLNGEEHSWLKVRSAVIRLVKNAYQERKFIAPAAPSTITFPKGIAVTLVDDGEDIESIAQQHEVVQPKIRARPATKAEDGLKSDAEKLKEQARQAEPHGQGENLLKSKPEQREPEPSNGKAP